MSVRRILLTGLAVCLSVGMLIAPRDGRAVSTAGQYYLADESLPSPPPWPQPGELRLAYVGLAGEGAGPAYVQRANESARGVIESRDGQSLRLRVIRSCKPPRRSWWNPRRYVLPGCKEDSFIRLFHEPYEVQEVPDLKCCDNQLDLKLVIQR